MGLQSGGLKTDEEILSEVREYVRSHPTKQYVLERHEITEKYIQEFKRMGLPIGESYTMIACLLGCPKRIIYQGLFTEDLMTQVKAILEIP